MKSTCTMFGVCVLVFIAGAFFAGCGKKALVKESPVTIVFYGDSVTFGYGLDKPAESFYGRIDGIMKAGIYDNIRTFNAGVPGNDTAEAFSRIGKVRALEPDIVVIAFGLNDCQNDAIGPVRFRQNLIRLTSGFPSQTKVILATSNTFMETGQEIWKKLNKSLDEYMNEVRKLSREKDYPLIDVHSAWRDQLRYDSRHLESMYIDPTHPSAKGHRFIFETYMDVLRKMIVK